MILSHVMDGRRNRLSGGLMFCVAALVLTLSGCSSGASANMAAGTVTSSPSMSSDSGRNVFVSREGAEAMEPTVSIGTKVIARRIAPKVGDIVVVHPSYEAAFAECGPIPHVVKSGGKACDAPVPRKAAYETIERVVAGPGDEVYVRSGDVFRRRKTTDKFVRETAPYIRACGRARTCDYPVAIKIPPDHWVLMGDNRGASVDSRAWGPVPTSWIVGVATELECRALGRRHVVWVRRTPVQGCHGVTR